MNEIFIFSECSSPAGPLSEGAAGFTNHLYIFTPITIYFDSIFVATPVGDLATCGYIRRCFLWLGVHMGIRGMQRVQKCYFIFFSLV